MSCEYCKKEDSKIIMEHKVIDEFSFGWGTPDISVKYKDLIWDKMILFIDRGYLRYADKTDSGCLEHGDKIKIKYCPFCGEKL